MALSVTATAPADGATGVDGTTPVVLSTSNPVDLASVAVTVSPPVRGRWGTRPGALVFTPSGAFPPSTRVSIGLSPGTRSVHGATVAHPFSTSFTTAAGSVLRLQQLLAELGYLPLRWTPAAGEPAEPSPEAADRAVFQPPAGAFTWAWSAPPASLVAQWTPGRYTVMVRGAVMAFEADHGLAVDGVAGPQVWAALLNATDRATAPTSQAGYTYALASKGAPETLTVWHNGVLIGATRANTGIPQAPTADGTFPIYERLAAQIMRGTNPDGTRYADPVAWVAYFNGGDAIHYIARSSYGYPQSLGCVEVPYQVAKEIWPYLGIGTLVSVVG
ncbi:MAG TPA: L,D-transpeptidase family protein [Acidimicrobiales bacterium]|nr:L,D-transpeptidase family protein [Acidimicrobiales bacterium]